MAHNILEALEVDFSYANGTKALDKLNLLVQQGEKLAILGANGAGKSTLFLHFNGIHRPHSGQINYKDTPIAYNNKGLIDLRKKVGIVFQDPDSQLFSASVWQDISFGPLNLGLSKKEVIRRVEQAMAATEIEDLENKPTHMLSYGQKKRVAIAGILAMEPEVIILDEPTAGLDPRHAREFMMLLNKLNLAGTTIIMSTHDVDLAYSWADRIAVMNLGKVIGWGEPAEIFSQPQLLLQADLALPLILEVQTALVQKGWLTDSTPLPRNIEELLDSIPEMYPVKVHRCV
ncbi:MAG TPA: ATP-binding cassette domain-containing protein [Desulfitobacteriaceae bacterium]|nr:ATP-binding cassette domain-containing protein [Desulfitobacteriaceae bacterium]